MYRERPSRLAGAVVWARTMEAGAARPVLPDGCMDLLWRDGELFVAGPDTHAYVPYAAAGVRYAGVRFAPGAGPAAIGVPAHELRDRRVALAALWPGAEVRRLTERIAQAPDPAAALEAVALARAEEPDPRMRAVVALLDAGRSVAASAEAVGLGTRALHRRSLDAFGYGPKTLARVLRLQRAVALVQAGVPYAEAALAAGCADQAHLAREMRALAGTTLTAYAEAANRETSTPSGSWRVA